MNNLGSMGKKFREHVKNNLGSREKRGYFRPGARSTDPP